jgi:putative transcription factor
MLEMVQCEMCGNEVASPKKMKIEGAVLNVCQDCSKFGVEINTSPVQKQKTKYSTYNSNDNVEGPTNKKKIPKKTYHRLGEMDMEFNEKIRRARELRGISQGELAGEINEKASFIKKLERGEVLPDEKVRKKLEKNLKINLLESDVE